MKTIFVCSPYRGDIEKNEEFARKASRSVVDEGHLPIAPHLLLPQFMNEETERAKAIEMNKQILRRCDELWVYGNEITEGMKEEINFASIVLGKRIVFK